MNIPLLFGRACRAMCFSARMVSTLTCWQARRAKAGAGESVWIDPEGYKAAVAERQQAFETELKKQQGGR